MPTQVSFTADTELKRRAMLRARREGVALKTILVHAMKAYVDGRISLRLDTENPVDPDVEEWTMTDPKIQTNAKKIADLLHSRHARSR